MTSSHVLPQTGSATQPAPSTLHSPDPHAIMENLATRTPDQVHQEMRSWIHRGLNARIQQWVSGRRAFDAHLHTPATLSSEEFIDAMRISEDLQLYFSEITGEIHGPMSFAPNERVEKIQQWLEGETFSDRCCDHEANKWLAHVEILTSCGMVLDECSYLDECPVCNGATLTVILKTVDDLTGLETESETAPDA